MVTKTELLTEVDRCLRGMTETLECSRLNAVQAGENLVVNSGRKIQQKNRNVIVQSGEYSLQYVTKRSQCCVLLDRLTERDC